MLEMLDMELFKKLDIDKKSEYLESIFLSRITHDDKLHNNLDTFLLGATETEMIEMYEVILNPTSLKDYIAGQYQKIKQGNQKMTDLKNSLKMNVLKLKEFNEQTSEKDLDNILNNI